MEYTNFDRCYGFLHVIEKGDTLYKIGKKYGVKVSALMFANPYVNIYNLQVGDELCIPRVRPIVIPVPLLREGKNSKENEKNDSAD